MKLFYIAIFYLLIAYKVYAKKSRSFVLNVGRKDLNPDCSNQSFSSLVVNGQFPGPILRMVKNDRIKVLVKNSPSSVESTSIHFHGIYQVNSNSADGVAGITQNPIKPGESFLHEFQIINQTGTFYYHAHVGTQDDTVQGPMIVYDTEEALIQAEREAFSSKKNKIKDGPYEYDGERILQFSEWWHQDSYERGKHYTASDFTHPSEPDSVLLNGRSVYRSNETSDSCRGFDVIDVEPNKVYRFRLIGSLTFRMLGVMISQHNMTLIENDSEYVKPLLIDHAEIVPGRRISVLVRTGNYTDGTMFPISSFIKWRVAGPSIYTQNGFGFIRYVSSDIHTSRVKITKAPSPSINAIPPSAAGWVLPKVRPYASDASNILSVKPTRTLILEMEQVRLSNNITTYKENGRLFRPWGNATTSLLEMVTADPDLGKVNSTDGYSTKHRTYPMKIGEVIDIVFQNMRGPGGICVAHPWHTHGHAHYLLSQGKGKYSPEEQKDVITYREPILQDVTVQYPDQGQGPSHCGWSKVRMFVNNPGVWAAHCHITEHMLQGKMVIFEVTSDPVILPIDTSVY